MGYPTSQRPDPDSDALCSPGRGYRTLRIAPIECATFSGYRHHKNARLVLLNIANDCRMKEMMWPDNFLWQLGYSWTNFLIAAPSRPLLSIGGRSSEYAAE